VRIEGVKPEEADSYTRKVLNALARRWGATWYLFEFVYTVPIGLLAGYLTALMAGRYELRHAAALAGLIAVMGVGSVIWSAGMKPAAADVLLTTLAGLACLTGGFIRSKRGAARA
jgi:hypothetical protein